MKVTPDIVRRIKAEMRAIVDANLPIQRLTVSVEDARDYFARTGQTGPAAHTQLPQGTPLHAVPHRRAGRLLLRRDGGEHRRHPRLRPVPLGEGLILQHPNPERPDEPAPFRNAPQLLHTYAQAAEWHAILNCENVADLNDMIRERKLREFIRVNEALQERRIEQIADQFIASGARLLLIAGPSSSGKTTFSHRLSIALRVHGLRPVKVSLDDYYLDRDKLPLEPDGTVDLETIDALDLDLLLASTCRGCWRARRWTCPPSTSRPAGGPRPPTR